MENETKEFLRDRYLYEEALMRHVCSKCIDFGEDRICYSRDPKGCAVFRYLPELVAIAEHLNDTKIEPYLEAVREGICMKCRAETPGGRCPLRDTLDCGLDRYLPLVLDAIEEVKERRADLEYHQWRQL